MNKADQRGIFETLFSEGKNLLTFTGIILVFSGVFVTVQSFIGEFLPHDTSYLGMDAQTLGKVNQNIVNFMFHDRISFGGTLISIGALYIWLSEFPLRLKQEWAWWVFFISGLLGFASFLTYLGYGYFDSYHGYASLLLIPVFYLGLYKSYQSFDKKPSFNSLKSTTNKIDFKSKTGIGFLFLYITSIGITLGGLVIMIVGMTFVYVPQDLEYMTMCTGDFVEINPRLTPLIAHDRASFGGGLFSIGLTIFFIIKSGTPTKNLWQILLLSLSVGFISGIGVHFLIDYLSFTHLAPAYLGAIMAFIGLILTHQSMTQNNDRLETNN
ncbi:hypothetical protein [Mangrovivirga cuniculi]|uniref:Uncharacterized protein n=1 Tax=Mangrovivirga cuniculi TaxID=2715131 RepID=A0A4D7JQ86_9BACT|nr:hypothetical protein [Mangrovivirga cuniculi]QCK15640.1 hypothetical protein DCC35_13245 [Mangrovivirga cuniculi]